MSIFTWNPRARMAKDTTSLQVAPGGLVSVGRFIYLPVEVERNSCDPATHAKILQEKMGSFSANIPGRAGEVVMTR